MYERDLSSPHATSILQTEKRPLLFAFIQGRSHLTRTPANNSPTGPRASHRLATIPPLPQAASQNTRTKVPTTPNIRVYWRAFADEKSKTERTNQPRRQVTQIRKRPRLFAVIQDRSHPIDRPAKGWPTDPRASHRLATIPPLPQAASQNARTRVPTTPNIRVYWRAFADRKNKAERTNKQSRKARLTLKRARLFAIIQERSHPNRNACERLADRSAAGQPSPCDHPAAPAGSQQKRPS